MLTEDLSVEKAATIDNLAQYRGNYSNSIVYKNIIPGQNSAIIKEADDYDADDTSIQDRAEKCSQGFQANETTNNDLWQMYLSYAAEALSNITTNGNYSENADNAAAQIVNSNNAIETENCQDELKAQLNRIEEMLKEIHLCNQKLYKSLLEYCTNYNE